LTYLSTELITDKNSIFNLDDADNVTLVSVVFELRLLLLLLLLLLELLLMLELLLLLL